MTIRAKEMLDRKKQKKNFSIYVVEKKIFFIRIKKKDFLNKYFNDTFY